MSFLKKLGQILATIATTALAVGPIASPLFGAKGDRVTSAINGIVNDLTLIGGVIVQVETALQGQAGADKFKAAVALVGPIVRTSEMVSGKKIGNPELLQKGIEGITQGVVDVLNSIKEESVATEVKTS